MDAVSPASALRFVLLEACRDDPFRPKMKRTTTWRVGVDRGFRAMEESEMPPKTLVVYAAKAGTRAQDGPAGDNSPFTKAILKHLPEPGVDIRLALGKVADDVRAATGQQQEPFYYNSLGGAPVLLKPGPTIITHWAEPQCC
jgi:hypothetical protein